MTAHELWCDHEISLLHHGQSTQYVTNFVFDQGMYLNNIRKKKMIAHWGDVGYKWVQWQGLMVVTLPDVTCSWRANGQPQLCVPLLIFVCSLLKWCPGVDTFLVFRDFEMEQLVYSSGSLRATLLPLAERWFDWTTFTPPSRTSEGFCPDCN